MKKILFLASICATCNVFGQLMLQSSDPASGTTSNLYLADSNAVRYENVTGPGVTWDYSNLLGVDVDGDGNPEVRTLSVANVDPNSADTLFPGATKKYIVNDQIITYYTTTDTNRISQGFKFVEPTLGDVFNFWDTIPQLLNTYPFDLGNSSYGPMSGRIYSYNATVSIDTFAVGSAFASIDGVGTLKLGAVDYPNTFRYHFRDTINSFVTINILGISSPVVLSRDVYEYYNYVTSPLPILVLYSVNNSILNVPNNIVLTRELPSENVGINDLGKTELVAYPNPSNGLFKVNIPNGSLAIVYNQFGQKLFTQESNLIDLIKYPKGIYFLKVIENDKLTTIRLINN